MRRRSYESLPERAEENHRLEGYMGDLPSDDGPRYRPAARDYFLGERTAAGEQFLHDARLEHVYDRDDVRRFRARHRAYTRLGDDALRRHAEKVEGADRKVARSDHLTSPCCRRAGRDRGARSVR